MSRLNGNFRFGRGNGQTYTPDVLPSQADCPSAHNLAARETFSPLRAPMA